ncbi:MAG: efflux RND transporter periplasmic adaptor subunit [Alphaproteobacteria bacterium]|nr:efflux RND transporter periplasmic adaptor subunit [Alphaproteobacteria bacterium]
MRRATLIAVGIAAVAGLWILSGQIPNESVDMTAPTEAMSDADEQRPRVRVANSTATAHVQELTVFGRTEADRFVDIRAETSGRVIGIEVNKGQIAEKDAVIVRLAMDDRQAKLTQAEAEVNYRKIAYDGAQSLAEKRFSAEVTVAEELAALESARASLRAIRLDMARTRIGAPFAGVIEKSPLEIGDLVRVGDVVAQLVDLDPITVSIEVNERQVSQVRIGQQAQARFANGLARAGTVTFVSRSGSDETRTFRVEIEVANSEFDIPRGLTADVTLLTESVMAHRISPAVLTLSGEGQLGVKIINDDDQVVFVPITVIAEARDGVWISGLPLNARLITIGQEFVRAGQLVDAVIMDGS